MVQLQGFRELSRKLDELSSKERVAALRKGVKAASRPVLDKARASIPKGTRPHYTHKGQRVMPGFASRNLVVRTKSGRGKNRVFAFIGPNAEAYYATQFVELGTSKQPAQPWLVPAFESSQDEAIKLIGDAIKNDIERIARKRSGRK